MMIREKIGKKINIYRRAKKMTLEELSQQVCKSKSTLSKYEKGAISIDIETLYDIASALIFSAEAISYKVSISMEIAPFSYFERVDLLLQLSLIHI